MPEPRRIVPEYGVRAGLNSTGSAILKNRIVADHATTVDGIVVAAALTTRPKGVTMQEIADGTTGDVQKAGKCTVEASAAIAKDARVGAAAGGKAVTCPATAGNWSLGRAATPAGADGDIIEVEIDVELIEA